MGVPVNMFKGAVGAFSISHESVHLSTQLYNEHCPTDVFCPTVGSGGIVTLPARLPRLPLDTHMVLTNTKSTVKKIAFGHGYLVSLDQS